MIVDVLNLSVICDDAGSSSARAKAGSRCHCVIGETPGQGRDEIARSEPPTEGLFGRPLQEHQTQLALALLWQIFREHGIPKSLFL
jgi:hypothetical protein